MTDEEIRNLIDGDPRELIKTLEDKELELVGNDDIARNMAIKKFSIPENQIKAVDFVFWFAYTVERTAEELIIYPETQVGGRKEALETIVNKLHFGDKIKIIEELYSDKNNTFIKLMRKVQDLRNNIAHGRFDNLKYGGYDLSNFKGRVLLIADLRDSLLKK